MVEIERDLLVSKAHNGYINSLSIEPESEQLSLCGGADSSVTIWDLDESSSSLADTNEEMDEINIESLGVARNPEEVKPLARLEVRKAHKFGISKVLWWPFGDEMFLTSSFDHTVKVWDTEALEEVYSFDLEHKVYNFDINPLQKDGLVAVAMDHPQIRLLDLKTAAAAHTLKGHEAGSVCCVKWSPTREYMLASGGSDGLVRIWDIRRANQQVAAMDLHRTNTSQALTPLSFRKSHRGVCNGSLWHPSGDEILSIGLDNKARVWDLTGEPGGGTNTSVNFGPLFQDRRQQTLEPCFFWPKPSHGSENDEEINVHNDAATTADANNNDTSKHDDDEGDEEEDDYLVLLPSDTGDVLMSQFGDGKLVNRLVPLGREARFSRQGCITSREGEFFSGTCDGSIIRWHEIDEDD